MNWNSTNNHYQEIAHPTGLTHSDRESHVFLYQERPVVTLKSDFLVITPQPKMVNGLISFSDLFNYAAFWVWGLAGRATLSELQRALQMSLLCSVKLKRRKDGPLTTDSCQLDGTLALSRPMSSSGGDKCLANQCAYKITALPCATHTSTWSDNLCRLQPLLFSPPPVSSVLWEGSGQCKMPRNKNQTNKNWHRERNPCSKMTQKGKYIDTLTCSELVHTNTERRQPIWCCYQKYYQKRIGKVTHLTFFPSSILSFSPLATRGHFGASSLRTLEILSFHKYLNIGSGVSGWGWNESKSITKGETWGFYRAERWVPKIFSSNIPL